MHSVHKILQILQKCNLSKFRGGVLPISKWAVSLILRNLSYHYAPMLGTVVESRNIARYVIAGTNKGVTRSHVGTVLRSVSCTFDYTKTILDATKKICFAKHENMAKLDERIGFIGGGNMAFAIGNGLVNRGIVKAGQVLASGPHFDNLERWRCIGAGSTDDNAELIEKSDIIFICVKPQILDPCSQNLRISYCPSPKDKDKLFVSVLAGVTLKTLEEKFSFIKNLKMIRTMPNTPMQVGEGCTVYTPGSYVTQQDLEKVHLMLNSLGIAQQVPESMIDGISGVAGCGPAYVYTIIEALADGAVKQGVPRQMAIQISAQTLLGAAKTVLLTGLHPAVLRDEVCSPGGSTICGVHELEKGQIRATLINAVEKATERSKQLGKQD